MRKVLVANRGEIAVRIIRACRDAGLASVAVYSEPDIDTPHARMADEAYALGGASARDTYLSIAKLLDMAARSGADAVHPGYGFLAENADFAEAVIGAGLTWIGPGPAAIRTLGDKVSARDLARRAGAPLTPGTESAVGDVAELLAFAGRYGVPIAIKAAYGGGGRGLKVATSAAEIPELFESATREAIAAFGRGECFAERYLRRPRHVETQCLADAHGEVVVLSTRDCTLQRRHQKLVEEAPAPFLTESQREAMYAASKAILRAAGYVGAGTCEFLLSADGEVSFLEVNTRLQVEHPVTEEVTGIDIVGEMFRIADGQRLGYGDPQTRGHSIEFRVNGEDVSRDFLPVPGTITGWTQPSGPGVRLDSGIVSGSEVSPFYDSLLAKLIVTGADRGQALARSRRALDEFVVAGIPTTLAFHRAVVRDPAFAPAGPGTPFSVHTNWIETEYAHPPEELAGTPGGDGPDGDGPMTVEVNGRRIEVRLPPELAMALRGGPVRYPERGAVRAAVTKAPVTAPNGARTAQSDSVTAPMQGTIVKIAVADGQHVEPGDLVGVVEAMKMEQPVSAHRAGTVTGLTVNVGDTIASGAALCRIAPA